MARKNFKKLYGYFWSCSKTQAFMRAKASFAKHLDQIGQRDIAIKHYQEMLELNPDDHQGIRYELVFCLFKDNRDKELNQLFDQYCDDTVTQWIYHRALWCFKKTGNSNLANQEIAKAIKANSHVSHYLLSQKKVLPASLTYMQPENMPEAVMYAYKAQKDWKATPGALSWLQECIALNGNKTSFHSKLKTLLCDFYNRILRFNNQLKKSLKI